MKVNQATKITQHQYNLKTGFKRISPSLQWGYELVLEDGSIHWCSESLYEKLIKKEYEKSKTPRPVITLA